MKGTNTNLNGIIPLAIKTIIGKLNQEEKESNNTVKITLKASYLEIYNETVNDLLDASKKNLEIRESLQRGVFVNNLTEVPITGSYEKAMQLLKQGEAVRVIAETKLNEKSSRSHSIFRLFLEITRTVDNKQKTLVSQLNLIDLAGSENVSKAKTDGIRMKEGSNINKSLLALSNVIQKLSSNPKSFVNYRDSKLTRLLQPALSGNSKTMIICTITEGIPNYSETLNTLHFGTKAKSIKMSIKVNEFLDEKSKILLENNQLKSKIKQLEDLITENSAKSSNDKPNNINNQNGNSSTNTLNTGTNSNNHNELISVLEKEVTLLKRILMSNEEIGETDVNSVSNEIMSTNSNSLFANLNTNQPIHNQSINPHHLMSASKHNYRSNSMMSSGKKMTDSARKIYNRDNSLNISTNLNTFNEPDITSSSIYRRCMTDMKTTNFAQSMYTAGNASNVNNSSMNNYILNTNSKKNNPSNFNNILNSNYKSTNHNVNNYSSFPHFYGNMPGNPTNQFDYMNSNMDDFLYNSSNDNSLQLLKENDELRKNMYEIRKNFLETVQSKDNQIKSMNYNYSMAIENCEKIIKEAEENFINLKMNYDRTKEDFVNKENELKNLNQTVRNLDANNTFYKEEIVKLNTEINRLNESMKGDNHYRELEEKYREIKENYEKLLKKNEGYNQNLNELRNVNEKLKMENLNQKVQIDNLKSENLSFKTQHEIMRKTNDLLANENGKLKNDIESYKNEMNTLKDKLNKMKGEVNQLNKLKDEKSGTKDKKTVSNYQASKDTVVNNSVNTAELENKISEQARYILQLESQIIDYKNNLEKIELTQISEYQKLLDESFNKITELQNELDLANKQIGYLDKLVKLSLTAPGIYIIKLFIHLVNSQNTLNAANTFKETPKKKSYRKEELNFVNSPSVPANLRNFDHKSLSKSKKDNSSNNYSFNKKNQNVSQFNFNESAPYSSCLKEENYENFENVNKNNESLSIISSNGKDFLGKKRKYLPRVYQNIIDKNLNTKLENVIVILFKLLG